MCAGSGEPTPESLTKPSQVLEFTRAARASRHSADSVPEMPKHLTEAATFEDMLDLTVQRRAHRVFVVDAQQQPVAIATLTDLMYAMAGEEPTGRPQVT